MSREQILLGANTLQELEHILRTASNIADPGERIRFLSDHLLGINYAEATLIGGHKKPEIFVINLEWVDCPCFSAKGVKVSSRHATGRKRHSIDNHFSNVSNSRKRTRLRSIFNAQRIDRRSPSISIRNDFLFETNQDEPYIQHTENNERIHSFIAAHNKNDLINNATNYSDEVSRHIHSVHGTINSSFTLATQKAGLSDELILQLTNIFAWDIDFATNLHHGDQFTVVYEETRIGNNSSDSQIIALRYSSERYVDTVSGRMVAIGRHEKVLVMIPYESDGRTLTPVTIHATSRQQINSRVKSGRFRNE